MNNPFLALLATFLLFSSCQSTDKNGVLEKNKAVVLEYHEVWNQGKMDHFDDILTSDFVCHYLTSEKWTGIKEAKKNISGWRAIFPD